MTLNIMVVIITTLRITIVSLTTVSMPVLNKAIKM